MKDFFIKREQGVIYLKSKSIVFFTKSKYFVGELKFESNMLKNMEVLDRKHLQRVLGEYIQVHALDKLSPVFIVGKDLVFERVIKQDNYNENTSAQSFKEDLPFDQSVVKVAVIQIEDNFVHLGVNGDYIDAIVEALITAKNEIQAIVPEQLISVLFEKESFLSRKFNDLVLENLPLVRTYDLFSKNQENKIVAVK